MASTPDCPQKSPIVQNVAPGTYWWCACGKSKSQPFCDCSHAGTDFEPVEVTVDAERRVAWCACKRSGNGAYCDGSHSRI